MKLIDVNVMMTNRPRAKDDPDELCEVATLALLQSDVRALLNGCLDGPVNEHGFPSALCEPPRELVDAVLAWSDVQNFFRDVVLHIAFKNTVAKALSFAGDPQRMGDWVSLFHYIPREKT